MALPRRNGSIIRAFRRGELPWADAVALIQFKKADNKRRLLHRFSLRFDYPTRVAGGFTYITEGKATTPPAFAPSKMVAPVNEKEIRVSEGIHNDLARYQNYIPGTRVTVLYDLPELYREAAVHADECSKLDKSPAGIKARQLLLDHLDEDQRRTYERYGYFDVVVWDDVPDEVRTEVNSRASFRVFSDRSGYTPEERELLLSTRRYRLIRGFPNGNVFMLNYHGQPIANVCLHPVEPYANDDTVLTQKLWIENNEEEFLLAGNLTRTSHLHQARLYQGAS